MLTMPTTQLAELWFDDVGEKFDTDEYGCSEHFVWALGSSSQEFVQSVYENGVLDPIVLRNEDGELGIVNGHHRFIVAYVLGIEEVPVMITDAWFETSPPSGPYSHLNPYRTNSIDTMLSEAIDRMFT